MTKITGEYQGDLHCSLIHESSGTVIYTDAPVDNSGKGAAFSPTDLVGAALGSCIATVLGIHGKKKNWDLKGMRFEVTKEMLQAPERRVARLFVQIWMPISLTSEERKTCERVAQTCPVHKSLHPGIEVQTIFHWPS